LAEAIAVEVRPGEHEDFHCGLGDGAHERASLGQEGPLSQPDAGPSHMEEVLVVVAHCVKQRDSAFEHGHQAAGVFAFGVEDGSLGIPADHGSAQDLILDVGREAAELGPPLEEALDLLPPLVVHGFVPVRRSQAGVIHDRA
jgi:hypothetical protein